MKEITATGGRTANPRLRRIEGRHNALVKELRRAFSRGELTSDGYCAIEGFRILEEAIRSGLRGGRATLAAGRPVRDALAAGQAVWQRRPERRASGRGRVGPMEGILA